MNNLLLKNLNNLQNELNDSLKTFKATKELSKRIPVALKLYDEKTPCNTLADYFDLKSLEVDKENCQILKGKTSHCKLMELLSSICFLP